jgi:hypothetical protein
MPNLLLSSRLCSALLTAVFACAIGLFLLPSTLILTRIQRQRASPSWFRLHVTLNGLTVALIALVFALGMAAVGTQDAGTQLSGDESDLHHKLGLAIFILVLLQALLGLVAHLTKAPSASSADLPMSKSMKGQEESRQSRHWTRYLHACIGLITVGLLYWITWDGLHTEWVAMSTEGTDTPEAVQILFWVLFIPPVAYYLVTLGSNALRAMEAQQQQQQPIMLGGKEGSTEMCDC